MKPDVLVEFLNTAGDKIKRPASIVFALVESSHILHCKKRVAVFPSTTGTLSKESLVNDIPAGDGKTAVNLFLQ